MTEQDWLAAQFDEQRAHLTSVAARVLGSASSAEDAVQEAWLRLSRSDASSVEDLRSWLTTVVARICLDMLRARRARPEEPALPEHREPAVAETDVSQPEHEALLADSMGAALLIVLDALSPAERLAFILHDMFAVSFEEIAPIIERTPAATRQLASRARRRVRGAATPGADRRREHEVVVKAFLAASRNGDFGGLVALLDPEAVARADAAAVHTGATAEVRGADAVATMFSGRARAARAALIDGTPGAVWSQRGELRVAFVFTITNGTVTAIDLIADPDRLRELQFVMLDQ